MAEEQTCFVISPIGQPETPTRDRSDKVFEYVIEDALENFEYKPIRADHIAEPGIITNDVIEYIVESPLVIADLTGRNANVFYELAIRHAYEKPTIQLIDNNEEIPFDVASARTIQFDLSDLESVDEAKSQIVEQINNIEHDTGNSFENPITVAENIRNLKQSSDPEDRSKGELVESISEMRSDLRSIETTLNSPNEIVPPEYIRSLFSPSNKNLREAKYSLSELGHIIQDIQEEIEKVPLSTGNNINDLFHEHEITRRKIRDELNRYEANVSEISIEDQTK